MLARLVRVVFGSEREATVLPFRLRSPRFLLSGHIRASSVHLIIPTRLQVVEARCKVVKVEDASSAFLVGPIEMSISIRAS
jgi:hypothetical protein